MSCPLILRPSPLILSLKNLAWKPLNSAILETHLKTGDTYRLKVKGWKKIFHANRDKKKARVAILKSDKVDFKTKAMKRDNEGHYIMIKGSIQEEGITIINMYKHLT